MVNNTNYDTEELKKFSTLSAHWWDPQGELKTLHQINPLRLGYILEKCPIPDQRVIDIGCGGGILSESLATKGAQVTGIDMSKELIDIATWHQRESGSQIEYLCTSAEAIANERPGTYDVVTCLEMLEHVPDPAAIVRACGQLAKPGGHVFFSTLNRNPKSYLFAILGAEYVLKLLPKNTHDYAKFIRPAELNQWAKQAKLTTKELRGITYHPLTQRFSLTSDVSVNYLFYARKEI